MPAPKPASNSWSGNEIMRKPQPEPAVPAQSAPTPEPRKCEVCNYSEPGWRYNRCPNCGEMAAPIPPTRAPGSADYIKGWNEAIEAAAKVTVAQREPRNKKERDIVTIVSAVGKDIRALAKESK